ncbi:MAG: hypothetical protein ACE5PV_12450 [Candidatus Poribacteria bacterium]
MVAIEILIGMICSLMGIALGYVTILSLFTGIQLFSKRRIISPDSEETIIQRNPNI